MIEMEKDDLIKDPPPSERSTTRLLLWKRMLWAVAVVVLLVLGICAGIAREWHKDTTYHRWRSSPFMWKTCSEVMYDTFSFELDLTTLATPCSSEECAALCTYSRHRLYMYCRGRYYQTTKRIPRNGSFFYDKDDYYDESSSSPEDWQFEEYGTQGLGAIWEDSKDCDELEMYGSELVCNYNKNQGGDNAPVCSRSSFYGTMLCDNGQKEYNYFANGCFQVSGSGSPRDWVIVDTTTNTVTSYESSSPYAKRRCRSDL